MELNTASEAISYSRKLEEESASFYEKYAKRFPETAEMWLSLAKENRKYVSQVSQVYYGVISDALEGGFAFRMTADAADALASLKEPANTVAALQVAIIIENKIAAFYNDAATQAKSLMADLPRVMATVAKKRLARIELLTAKMKG
jgi:hypothetical protein